MDSCDSSCWTNNIRICIRSVWSMKRRDEERERKHWPQIFEETSIFFCLNKQSLSVMLRVAIQRNFVGFQSTKTSLNTQTSPAHIRVHQKLWPLQTENAGGIVVSHAWMWSWHGGVCVIFPALVRRPFASFLSGKLISLDEPPEETDEACESNSSESNKIQYSNGCCLSTIVHSAHIIIDSDPFYTRIKPSSKIHFYGLIIKWYRIRTHSTEHTHFIMCETIGTTLIYNFQTNRSPALLRSIFAPFAGIKCVGIECRISPFFFSSFS